VANEEYEKSMEDLAEDGTLDEGEYASPNESDEAAEGGSEAESILIFLLFTDLGDIVGKSRSDTGLVSLLEVPVEGPAVAVDIGAVRSSIPTLGLPNPPPNSSVLLPPPPAACTCVAYICNK